MWLDVSKWHDQQLTKLNTKDEFQKSYEGFIESQKWIQSTTKDEIKELYNELKDEINIWSEELLFLKEKIEKYHKQLELFEDINLREKEPTKKYMFKFEWFPIINSKNQFIYSFANNENSIVDFIDEFLLKIVDYLRNEIYNNLNINQLEEMLLTKKWLLITWKEAGKIILNDKKLSAKLLTILESESKNTISFNIKSNWEYFVFDIEKTALQKALWWKTDNINMTDFTENWEGKEKKVNIESINDVENINIQWILDEISELDWSKEDKLILLDFLTDTDWYPKSKNTYIKIHSIVNQFNLEPKTKTEIEQIIFEKEKNLSDKYINIIRYIENSNITKISQEFLIRFLKKLKENWISEIEEKFLFKQVRFHETLQWINTNLNNDYNFYWTDIIEKSLKLQKQFLWQEDLDSINNNQKEIFNNVNKLINSDKLQGIIKDSNIKISDFKLFLLTIYINVNNITDVKDVNLTLEDIENMFKKHSIIESHLYKIKHKDDEVLKINFWDIIYTYEFNPIEKKLEEEQQKQDFNLITFIDNYWLPKDIIKYISPFINQLEHEFNVPWLINKNSSKQEIIEIQKAFTKLWKYRWALDWKYESIKKSIENYQVEKWLWKDWKIWKNTRAIIMNDLQNIDYSDDLIDYKINEEIESRLNELIIYFLHYWSSWEKWKKSNYLSNKSKRGLFWYEIYNHWEKYRKALFDTKLEYKKTWLKETPLWLEKEISKDSSKQWINSKEWNKKRQEILFWMRNKIKAVFIIENLWNSDFQSPLNLTTQQQIVVFLSSLINNNNSKDLHNYFYSWDKSKLNKFIKQHFNKKVRVERQSYKKIIASNKKTLGSFQEVTKWDFPQEISSKLWEDVLKTKLTWTKNGCGVGVWMIFKRLNIDISDIPTTGRDGYRWIDFLEEWVKNKTFVKVQVNHPKDAMKWWVIPYDKWYLWTKARRVYWHIEVKWADDRYYHSIKSHEWKPGWSSYFFATKYEKKVIKWEIDNPELFRELTGYTWYVYYPIKNRK